MFFEPSDSLIHFSILSTTQHSVNYILNFNYDWLLMMVLMKEWLKNYAQVVRCNSKKNRRNFGKNEKWKVRELFCVWFTASDYVEVESAVCTIWHLIFLKRAYSALEIAKLIHGEDTGVRGLTFLHSVIAVLSSVLPEMRAREREVKIDGSLVSPCCG